MTEMRGLNNEELSDFDSLFTPLGGTIIDHGDMTELQIYSIAHHGIISSFRSVVGGELRILPNIHTPMNDSVTRSKNVKSAREAFRNHSND